MPHHRLAFGSEESQLLFRKVLTLSSLPSLLHSELDRGDNKWAQQGFALGKQEEAQGLVDAQMCTPVLVHRVK